ncbi:hypothetical protein RHSIM_Rhsim06G0213600 [Rhododendron simsii]|uniref:FBD domain-containing protein n=1 Tax=Rhododendron simsii TaxID=118357 RepID=A0A834GXL6_RHOSS|nr:hypothetical protein RHSIM_Rhsim06G0213600 [Rhododendron simsii]
MVGNSALTPDPEKLLLSKAGNSASSLLVVKGLNLETALVLLEVPCLEKFRLRVEECCSFEFPHVFFTIKTLVNLTLQGCFLLRIPTSVCLPSLKILNLVELHCENEDSAQNLFSRCPVLEELHMSGNACPFANSKTWNISVPTLKHLTVFHVRGSSNCCRFDNQVYKLVVNAPRLEQFDLSDSVTMEFSLVNLTSLLKAKVGTCLFRSRSPHKSCPNASKLLTGIANVKFLDLKVKGCIDDSLNPLLTYVLRERALDSAELWRPAPQVPCCLSWHLKEVEIPQFDGKEYQLELVKYLLKNATVLKKMAIGYLNSGVIRTEKELYSHGVKTQTLTLTLGRTAEETFISAYFHQLRRRFLRLYFDKQKVLNISVPTLKRLVLNRQGDDAHLPFSDHDGESQHKLIVNTPKLEYLDIRDCDADEFSFENLSSLLDARINVGLCFSGPVSSSNLLKLLHGIENVKFLRFSATNYDDYVLPTMNPLHNLTYLGLQDATTDGWNVDLLNVFLEYSPNLEVLVLEVRKATCLVNLVLFWSIAYQSLRKGALQPWVKTLTLRRDVDFCIFSSTNTSSYDFSEEVIYENGDSAHNLIHGCPALEDLHIYMFYFNKQKVLNISVPTLKRLVLFRQGDDGHLLFSEHKLTVNTPKLEYLDITDYVAVEFSLENLSSLLDARINVGPCCSGSISSSNLLKLLHGIANVKFLRFSSTNSDDYVLPTINPLHNLTYLELQYVADGWNKDLLNVFLEYSPNLEVLVLEKLACWIFVMSACVTLCFEIVLLFALASCCFVVLLLGTGVRTEKELYSHGVKTQNITLTLGRGDVHFCIFSPAQTISQEVIYENGDSAHNLIHGCPALEDLHIYRLYFDKQKVLNISVPTLKRLVLIRLGDDAHLLFSDYDGESQHKLIINTPKLEYLDITDCDADEFSLENLSSLLNARINVGPCFSGPVSSSNLFKLLHGIANVKFLKFSSDNSDDYVLPTINPLHNLTYLELQDVTEGWNVDLLNVFLENSPNLEVLVLKPMFVIEIALHVCWCHSVTGGELNVSVSTLRRLTITRFGDRIHHHLTKLLVNAPKLEHIHLSDYVTQEFLLENLSSLLRACLVIGGDCSRPLIPMHNRLTIYDGCISMLLTGIANVKSLDFFSEPCDYRLPTFPNLTHLRLGGRNGGWNLKLLNEFLECSPNLQVLTLEVCCCAVYLFALGIL